MSRDEAAWLRQHADVLFDMDRDGRLTRVNEPEPEPAPRLFLARGREVALAWFREDVPGRVVDQCGRRLSDLPRWDGGEPDAAIYDPLREALAEGGPIFDDTSGPAFRFPPLVPEVGTGETLVIDESSAHLLDHFFPYTRTQLAWRAPVVVAVRNGAAVAACYCARRRPGACEAGVATAQPFQGQGLATAVVQAWRKAVEAAGTTPLYSTSWDNVPSLRVAAKLGLVAYADTLALA